MFPDALRVALSDPSQVVRMIPPPLAPSAVLTCRISMENLCGLELAGDGAGTRFQQKMFVQTRTQYPAKRRDTGSQEVVG